MGPTSRTPSMVRIERRFSQPMRLLAITSRAVSW